MCSSDLWANANITFQGPGTIIYNSILTNENCNVIDWEVIDQATAEICSTNNRANVLRVNNGVMRLNRQNAFWSLRSVPELTVGMGWPPDVHGTLDMNGYDLTVSRLTDYHDSREIGSAREGSASIVSDTPATLTVDFETFYHYANNENDVWTQGAEGGSRFAHHKSMIRGPITLVKNGTGKLLIGRQFDMSGDIVLNDGTLVLTAAGDEIFHEYGNARLNNPVLFEAGDGGFGPGATNIFVNGGTLAVRNDNALSRAADVTLSPGAIIDMADGVNATVRFLHEGRKLRPKGVYGSSSGYGARTVDDVYFTGPGTLTVLEGTQPSVVIVR